MKNNNVLEIMEYVDADFISEADSYKAKRSAFHWAKWGTVAACLCLAVVGVLFLIRPNSHEPIAGGGGTPDAGGLLFPEGIDPVTYSVAVYPATEDVKNIETADVTSIKEGDLQKTTLAEHLPAELPEGFHFGSGSIYETVMQDGTHYHMLRIEYITGKIPEQQFSEDGGAIAPNPNEIGEQILVMVVDFMPKTDADIYLPDEITPQMLVDAGLLYIQYGDFYVGIEAQTADTEDAVWDIIKSIR